MLLIKRVLFCKEIQKKIVFIIVLFFWILSGCQQDQQHNFENWSVYKGDAESSSYSSLEQINKQNVHQLQLAWTFSPNDAPEGSRPTKYEVNPIIIDTVMYATSARHWLYAINAKTGEIIWSYDPFEEGEEGGIKRGVTWWEDGDDKRILFTASNYLIAVDAHNGKPIPDFGDHGKVDLKFEHRTGPEAWVIPTSPGIVYEDLIILGSEVSELYGAAPGDIRAFNARTGKLEWTFHTIPHPGEPGYETWPEDAWQYVGGANNWGGMSLDEQRGIVYIPLGSPSYDYYGADRIGKNLYGNSLVALEAKTGKYIWHFQAVHHDLWDYDLPAPANLVTVEREGKMVDAVALTTKIGFLFLLDRETGEPLFPVEERPVPASTIPGEESWPTQPFPLKPEPYARQFITEDDLTDISPEARDSVLRVFRELRYEGLYTPPDLQGTLMVPGSRGGSEWGGAAYDPATGVLYINSNESPEIARIQKAKPIIKQEDQTMYNIGKAFYSSYCANCHGEDRKGLESINPSLVNIEQRMTQEEALHRIKAGGGKMPPFASIVEGYEEEIISYLFEINKEVMAQKSEKITDTTTQYINLTAYSHFRDPQRRNAIKPPWGTLNAINLNTGDYEWRIPLGNYPELQKEGEPPTGTENWGGPIVTAGGLVFIAATMDNKFRAFDKETGEMLWETTLPGNGYATPATYMVDGRQYISIAVMGSREEPSGHIMAFTLSD
jgi:quinoprotein glucose dehydrogenase